MDKELAEELLTAKLDHYRDSAREIIASAGTSEQARTIESSIQSADDALARKDMDALQTAVEALRQALAEPRKAERLKEEGKGALRDDDARALRT